jgi:predicted DNA-binding mobile mystery protein A
MPIHSDKSARDLVRLQVDEALDRWRSARLPKRPGNGWARTIRTALGMTARVLAARMGISEPGLRKLENGEISDTITLGSLRRLAEALDCDLEYALVPRKRLDDVLMDRARLVAEREFRPISHTMALEQQGVTDAARAKQIEAWARSLVSHGSARDLWS